MTEIDGLDPLLDPSALPLGAPDFTAIAVQAFPAAFERGISDARAELEAIAIDPAAPTFDNTMVALERVGAQLARVRRIFYTLTSVVATAELQAIEPSVSAMLTDHGLATAHDPRLFARVKALWAMRETLPLDTAQRRLLHDSYYGFVDGGAELDAAGKARFAEIAQRLSALSITFGQNVLAATAAWQMLIDATDIAGLPASTIAAAAGRAEAKGHIGRYLLTLDRGDAEAVLTFSKRRHLREAVWRAFTTRCDGGEHDNRAIVNEILALRQEHAALLGYSTFADYALVNSMAKTPDAAIGLLMRVWGPALAQAAAEQADLQRLADRDGIDLAAWDWRFYAEQVRRARYDLDGAAVKAHLTLAKVRAAAFATAGRLYGLRFERVDLPVWHGDVTAWSVSEADGAPLGLLYTDDYARAEKYGGAWMGSLRVQEKLDGAVLPIVYLVANFAKAGADTGLSIDEARTSFHEFGHALHALLSDVVYPSQAGTAVARDFVEFPSKFMEHWIVAPETLGELGLPDALIAAIGRADDFGQGFATVEFLASAIIDLALHQRDLGGADAVGVAQTVLDDAKMPRLIAPRHGLTHFTHVFDGGYAARYYSYLWAEVLDADAFAAFGEAGDLFDPILAERFRREVLAYGNARDPAESSLAFRGRAPDEAALLRDRRLI